MTKNQFILSFLLSFSLISLAQNNQILVNKIAKEICTCIEKNEALKNNKEAYDKCYDLKLENLNEFLTKDEISYYHQNNNSKAINRGLFLAINQNCAIMNPAIKNFSLEIKPEFPTNINESNFIDIHFMNKQFVALEGIVKKVQKKNKRLYSKVYLGEHFIWVESMIESGFEKTNAKLKFLGKVSDANSFTRKGGSNFHISAYGIVDTNTNDFMYYPGFEDKMNTWRNGEIPINRN